MDMDRQFFKKNCKDSDLLISIRHVAAAGGVNDAGRWLEYDFGETRVNLPVCEAQFWHSDSDPHGSRADWS